MRIFELLIESEHNSSQAIPELNAELLGQKKKIQAVKDDTDQVYDIINDIMMRIAKAHKLTGDEIHDMWVSKYKQVPDTWIMDK